MGLTPDAAVGKAFRMNSTGPVVGVVKDFHFEGLQKSLEPLVMTVRPSWFGYVSLRLDAADVPETLAYVERTWQSLVPTVPFEYFFLNDDFDRQYRAEEQFGQVFAVFAVIVSGEQNEKSGFCRLARNGRFGPDGPYARGG